jgi:L-ascorbate metabolism protein UlaG (beta-lactamase superfamily)
MIKNIHWLGHASFRIDAGDKTIYIDPYRIRAGALKADIILATHDHFDHNSLEDIAKLKKETTVIVAPADAAKKHAGNVRSVEPGQTLTVEGITVETVPAYNTGKDFHPRKNKWVGYILTVGGVRIYHAGDTDYIPEMDALKADIAMLPVGGTYTMTAEQAARAVDSFKPKVAVPMHYNSIVGTAADADRFKRLCKTKVEILQQE